MNCCFLILKKHEFYRWKSKYKRRPLGFQCITEMPFTQEARKLSTALKEQSNLRIGLHKLWQVYFFFRMIRASTTFKPLPSSYTRPGLAAVSATSSRRS